MEAKLEGDVWTVLSDSGHTYKVTNTSCTCPQFIIRLRGKGVCKHMTFISNLESKDEGYDDIIRFIRFNGQSSYSDIEKEFGSDVISKLQILEKKGEIIYNRRKDNYSILE